MQITLVRGSFSRPFFYVSTCIIQSSVQQAAGHDAAALSAAHAPQEHPHVIDLDAAWMVAVRDKWFCVLN
jgi:hypothetical protein